MKRKCRQDKIFIIVDSILALFFLLICLYPLYFILIASFSNPSLVAGGKVWIIPRGLTLDGYKMMLAKSEIWRGYGNTILYTLTGTAINLIFTISAVRSICFSC